VPTQRPGDLLRRFDEGAHGLPAPLIQGLRGAGGLVVIPELLKRFLEKVSADDRQVGAARRVGGSAVRLRV
jgi:hypothetical protein